MWIKEKGIWKNKPRQACDIFIIADYLHQAHSYGLYGLSKGIVESQHLHFRVDLGTHPSQDATWSRDCPQCCQEQWPHFTKQVLFFPLPSALYKVWLVGKGWNERKKGWGCRRRWLRPCPTETSEVNTALSLHLPPRPIPTCRPHLSLHPSHLCNLSWLLHWSPTLFLMIRYPKKIPPLK